MMYMKVFKKRKKTHLQHNWKVLSGLPSDSDLVCTISHTEVPSESKKGRRQGQSYDMHKSLQLISVIDLFPLSTAIRWINNHTWTEFPVGDLRQEMGGDEDRLQI